MNSYRKSDDERVDALSLLKDGQRMLEDGKKQLALAQETIDRAQKVIDQSAQTLRNTWGDRHPQSREVAGMPELPTSDPEGSPAA